MKQQVCIKPAKTGWGCLRNAYVRMMAVLVEEGGDISHLSCKLGESLALNETFACIFASVGSEADEAAKVIDQTTTVASEFIGGLENSRGSVYAYMTDSEKALYLSWLLPVIPPSQYVQLSREVRETPQHPGAFRFDEPVKVAEAAPFSATATVTYKSDPKDKQEIERLKSQLDTVQQGSDAIGRQLAEANAKLDRIARAKKAAAKKKRAESRRK